MVLFVYSRRLTGHATDLPSLGGWRTPSVFSRVGSKRRPDGHSRACRTSSSMLTCAHPDDSHHHGRYPTNLTTPGSRHPASILVVPHWVPGKPRSPKNSFQDPTLKPSADVTHGQCDASRFIGITVRVLVCYRFRLYIFPSHLLLEGRLSRMSTRSV